MTKRQWIVAALAAAGTVIVVGAGVVLWRSAPSSAAPVPRATVTVQAPAPSPSVKIEKKWKVVHRVHRVVVPGPTVTVTAPSAGGDSACISALFGDIQSWTTLPGRRVPNGWWDSRCPIP